MGRNHCIWLCLGLTSLFCCVSFIVLQRRRRSLTPFTLRPSYISPFSALVGPTIAAVFILGDLWSEQTGGTDSSALRHLFIDINKSGNIQLEDLLGYLIRKRRSFLCVVSVEHEGRTRIDSKIGAHVTSYEVLADFKKRDDKKKIDLEKKQASSSSRYIDRDYKELSKDIGWTSSRRGTVKSERS